VTAGDRAADRAHRARLQGHRGKLNNAFGDEFVGIDARVEA
jgi:hypothetical protein